jgi:hypothetical protein
MAVGRSVVASPQALGGLELDSGRHVQSADSADAWVRHVCDLMADDKRRRCMERAAAEHVRQRFAWREQLRPMVAACLGLAGQSVAEESSRSKVSNGLELKTTQSRRRVGRT